MDETKTIPFPLYENSNFARRALAVLKNNLEEIGSVCDWLERMNYSRSRFYSKFEAHFEAQPKVVLRAIRYRHIQKLVHEFPNATSYGVAQEVGLKNEQSLYLFLSRNFDTNFTELREKVLNEDLNYIDLSDKQD